MNQQRVSLAQQVEGTKNVVPVLPLLVFLFAPNIAVGFIPSLLCCGTWLGGVAPVFPGLFFPGDHFLPPPLKLWLQSATASAKIKNFAITRS